MNLNMMLSEIVLRFIGSSVEDGFGDAQRRIGSLESMVIRSDRMRLLYDKSCEGGGVVEEGWTGKQRRFPGQSTCHCL